MKTQILGPSPDFMSHRLQAGEWGGLYPYKATRSHSPRIKLNQKPSYDIAIAVLRKEGHRHAAMGNEQPPKVWLRKLEFLIMECFLHGRLERDVVLCSNMIALQV